MSKIATSGKRVLVGDSWHDDNGPIAVTPDEWDPPMTDDEINTAALSDPDCQPLTHQQLDRMRRVSLVKRIRWTLHLSREQFSAAFGIPEETVRAWERHDAEPSAAELSYLRVIQTAPDAIRDAVRDMAA